MSAVELAKQTGTDPAEVLARIRELERAAGR
jgi:DNA-binding Lrp family transcriptional regulator